MEDNAVLQLTKKTNVPFMLPKDVSNEKIHHFFLTLNAWIYEALSEEVALFPKPGLVDTLNSGAHNDMDILTFMRSSAAISPFMAKFAWLGFNTANMALDDVLPILRPLGIECEQAMLFATTGVNTHKGAIFAFSLICTAIGRRVALGQVIHGREISRTVSAFCHGIVERELASENKYLTAGMWAYQQFGYAGARGEAESGFATVFNISLPVLLRTLCNKHDPTIGYLEALIHLMSVNNDTNVISRGGIKGLAYVKENALEYISSGGVLADPYFHKLASMNYNFVKRNLSPGGSADLLAVTIFFYKLNSYMDTSPTQAWIDPFLTK